MGDAAIDDTMVYDVVEDNATVDDPAAATKQRRRFLWQHRLLARSRLLARREGSSQRDKVPREERYTPFKTPTYFNNIVSVHISSPVSGYISMWE